MRFTDAPLYVRQIIIASFIFTFVLAIIGLFAAIRLCKKTPLYPYVGGHARFSVCGGVPDHERKSSVPLRSGCV